MRIISNKAEPESFHFEINGDNYDFSDNKPIIYYRQEATKELFQNLGSDILYNNKFTDMEAYNGKVNDIRGPKTGNYYKKSTIFPLYYNRIDAFEDIYHRYQEIFKTYGTDY